MSEKAVKVLVTDDTQPVKLFSPSSRISSDMHLPAIAPKKVEKRLVKVQKMVFHMCNK